MATTKITATQQNVIDGLKEGKRLTVQYTAYVDGSYFYHLGGFDGERRGINVKTILAMVEKGLIVEKERYESDMSSATAVIVYQLPEQVIEETQEPEQVEVAKEPTSDTITYTIVERDEQGKSPFYARVFVPGEEVQDFDPIRHDAHWMHSKSDLVFAVNKAFKGAWYLSAEKFEARVAETKIETVPMEQERRDTMEGTEKYYFVDRGNSGGFYIRLHRGEGDEPLFSSTPHTYEVAQKMVDRFNQEMGYREPVDDDFVDVED